MSDDVVIEAVHDDAGIIGYPLRDDQLVYHWSPTSRRDLIGEAAARALIADVDRRLMEVSAEAGSDIRPTDASTDGSKGGNAAGRPRT